MSLILRNTKGSPLTWTEMDDNLTYLESLTGDVPGTNYVIVKGTGTPTENGTELEEAYITAKTMSPDSDNIISLLVHPGYYEVATQFVMDTPYINLISLTSNRDINLILTGGGSPILIDTDYTHVRGINIDDDYGPFEISNDLPNIVIENCKGGVNSFGKSNIIKVSGTFIDCEAYNNSFGHMSEASGVFIRCISGGNSFGHMSEASGTFIDCKSQDGGSFGGGAGLGTNKIASGTFIRCSSIGLFSGPSFGYDEASGIFIDCESQSNNSFGHIVSSGEFTNCKSVGSAFGGPGGSTSSGVYNNCIAGDRSFGSDNVGSTLTGQLYYCRLTDGTFGSVSGTGRTYFCIDGNGDVNNQ